MYYILIMLISAGAGYGITRWWYEGKLNYEQTKLEAYKDAIVRYVNDNVRS